MTDHGSAGVGEAISANLYDVDSSDPRSELVDRTGLSAADVAQVGLVMNALARLRLAEQQLSDASQAYMKLSAQDMRALHYLIVAGHRGEVVTPGMIAAHLGISAASTTKMLNRLEKGGHIVRHVHPVDRRAFAIEVTPETEASAKHTVGRQHAKKFDAAARLTSDERETVMRFLDDMAQGMSLHDLDWARPA